MWHLIGPPECRARVQAALEALIVLAYGPPEGDPTPVTDGMWYRKRASDAVSAYLAEWPEELVSG